jgi:hypothetical protein
MDATGSPVGKRALQELIEAAIQTWNNTGLVSLELVEAGSEFDVLCSWKRNAHDGCPNFGHDSSVAHTGPLTDANFIHLDSGRDWSSQAPEALPLEQVLLHELGHALGLGHSNDPAAVMHPNYDDRRNIPNRSDLAGLASLYGGGQAGAGDLTYGDDPIAIALYAVAPRASTGFGLLDVNHNERDELLVWRTDSAGHGALMVYHFNERLELVRSEGPLLSCVLPGEQVLLGKNAQGRGLLLSIRSNGSYSARQFHEGAFPLPIAPGTPFQLIDGPGDNDGDGELDSWPVTREKLSSHGAQQGDLDGDGQEERLSQGK